MAKRFECGKAYLVAHRKRHLGNGESNPPFVCQQNRSANETHHLTNGRASIARLSIKQKDSFLVTDDVDDFLIIKREMKDLQVISADEFFA
ncbi:MAG: hypothetical protein LH614_16755 [Pyrinomonadaceae bacterium]|nr:hypothetical protein [Pyrinomonadaceae bacterium]